MTYTKPDNITYVEMCIYFDNHIYSQDRNDSLLYQYLYHIIYMLACKKRYFVSWEDYDNFAIYMATKVYLRYINPNHQGEESRIKSVLNYCKTLLYPTKVDYQKETFATILGSNPTVEENYSILQDDMAESVQSSHRDSNIITEDLLAEFKLLPKLVMEEVNNTPYTKDKVFMHRLYMSVLITLIKGITLSNASKMKVQRRLEKGLDTDSLMLDILTKERETSLTLWRLSPVYSNLVNLLAFKVRKHCAESVVSVNSAYRLSEEDVNAVLATAFGNTARDDNEEF